MHRTHHPVTFAVLLMLAGCAAPPERAAQPWRMQPLWRVDEPPLRSMAPGYAALARKYEGEGRLQQAAEAYRKAAVADPARADYREAFDAVQARMEPAAIAAAVADAPRAMLVLQSTPTVPALTLGSDEDAMRAMARARATAAVVPQLAPPVVASPQANEPASVPDLARVEIVNGNGVRGAAARLRDALGTGPKTRLLNRAPYREASTTIEYRPGFSEQARALARRMPVGTRLIASHALGTRADVRVVLGRDLRSV